MVRFYSQNGPILGQYANNLGAIHYLATDSKGGALGWIPDSSMATVLFLQGIPGVIVIPSSPNATLSSTLVAALPTGLGITTSDTVITALTKIHALSLVTAFDPNFV